MLSSQGYWEDKKDEMSSASDTASWVLKTILKFSDSLELLTD